MRIVALSCALITAVLGATSCQQLLSDVPPIVFGTDAGGPEILEGRPRACDLGSFRCTGSKREICTQLADGNIGWLTQEDCLSEALCTQGLEQPVITCMRAACNLDEGKCEGATPERCRADLTEFEPYGEVCPNAGQCSTSLEDCPNGPPCCAGACIPGTIRCNAATMERCADNQESWELVGTAPCDSPELCQQGLDLCSGSAGNCACSQAVCEPGQKRCSPDNPLTLEVCNAGQTGWNFVDTCATTALCDLGTTRVELGCEPPPCAVGQFACTTEGVLQQCRENRTGFDDLRACDGGAAFCDSVAGTCTDVPCGPGDQRCNGAVIEQCRVDRTGFEPTGQLPCATAALCGPNQFGVLECTPPTCAVDQFDCFGSPQLQRCNDDRNGFVPVGAACVDGANQPRADLCSADRRRCDFCVPNRRECTPDQGSSRTCNAQGTGFGFPTGCPLGCVAATGACNTCVIGEFRCQGGTLQRCNDGRSFGNVLGNVACNGASRLSCNFGQSGPPQSQNCGAAGCNTTRLQCNECSGTQRRCAGGSTFQTCTANGTFGAAQGCGAGLACEGAGLCRCAAGSRRCSDADLLVCSLDRTTFNLVESCDSPAACNAATGNSCPDCLEGQCINGQPFSCTGGQLVPAAACGPGLSCVGAGLCRCTPNDLRCTGGVLQECNGAGTAFVGAAACNGDQFRFCPGGPVADTDTCDNAALCTNNGCIECNVDGNCDDGEVCVDNTCQPGEVAPPGP